MAINKGQANSVSWMSVTTAGTPNVGPSGGGFTPTVFINKDGAGQQPPTNPPFHEGNGEWSLMLTDAEMNANKIAVTAIGGGLIPSTTVIYTEENYTPGRADSLDTLNGLVGTLIEDLMATPLVSRNQNDVSEPTVMDALAGSDVVATGKMVENTRPTDIVKTFDVYDRNNRLFRRFYLTVDPAGVPYIRA